MLDKKDFTLAAETQAQKPHGMHVNDNGQVKYFMPFKILRANVLRGGKSDNLQFVSEVQILLGSQILSLPFYLVVDSIMKELGPCYHFFTSLHEAVNIPGL